LKIVSANLNQRIGNVHARSRFESWLTPHSPRLVLAQEPFRPNLTSRPTLKGYGLISTSTQISSWAVDDLADSAKVIEHSERWHEIRLEALAVHNVYLSPYKRRERTDLLLAITAALKTSDVGDCVIVGDFNLAPRLEDGMSNGRPSAVTGAAERRALERLLESGGLIDVLCPDRDSDTPFTFERLYKNGVARFRCDLALVTARLKESASIRYDHRVRTSENAFTDHSAIVLDLP
jgi:exonuclease III